MLNEEESLLVNRLSDHEPPTLPESSRPQTSRDSGEESRKEVLTDDPELVDEILKRRKENKAKPESGCKSEA